MPVKSKVKISQYYVAFSEYMKFTICFDGTVHKYFFRGCHYLTEVSCPKNSIDNMSRILIGIVDVLKKNLIVPSLIQLRMVFDMQFESPIFALCD